MQVRFIVMNNLFQTDLHVQRKYDLKGSTQGRFSGKVPTPNTILKDLDLDISLKLEEGWHERYTVLQTAVSFFRLVCNNNHTNNTLANSPVMTL